MMKFWAMAALILFGSIVGSAQSAIKPCGDLKDEIAKELDAKGVTNYSLTIVDKGKEAEGKIVGSCEGGTKNIVYSKTTSESQPAPADKQKAK